MAKNEELLSQIKEILIKKANGYFYNEESYEYINKSPPEENEQIEIEEIIGKGKHEKSKTTKKDGLTLVKKKVTSHYIPPDMLAVKVLLENFGEKIEQSFGFENMTLNELIEYKNNLIKQLSNIEKENDNEN